MAGVDAGSFISGGLGSGLNSLAVQVANTIADQGLKLIESNWLKPDVAGLCVSAAGSGAGEFLAGWYVPIVYVIKPSNNDLQSFNDFLESYGNRIEKWKVPNLCIRKGSFTFVRTKGAVVRSAMRPAALQMETMLNEGTRFWNTDKIGTVPSSGGGGNK